MSYTPYRDVPTYIDTFQPFKGNSMEGGTDLPLIVMSMRGDHREAFYSARANIDYLVTSYGTPIAWHTPEQGWIVPNVKYSATTSRQQNIVKRTVPEFTLI